MSRLLSPNEFMDGAYEMMLGGRRPESEQDWQLVVNFLAANIDREIVANALTLFKVIYEIPLDDWQIEEIVAFQLARKRE